jgi:hypothetical protein
MSRADLVARMVSDLRCVEVDLGDEREVIRALSTLRYLMGDIVACVDEVTEETRRQGLKRSWA